MLNINNAPSLDDISAILSLPSTPLPQASAVNSVPIRNQTIISVERKVVEQTVATGKRSLQDPLQIQPKSARAMSNADLANVLIRSITNERPPYALDVTSMLTIFKHSGTYTGQDTRLHATLYFIHDMLQICSTDREAALRQWGQPSRPQITKLYLQYLAQYFPTIRSGCNGKTLSTIIGHLGTIIWPKTTKQQVKPKWRRFLGIRLKTSMTQSNEESSTLHISTSTVMEPTNVTNLFQTPLGSSLSNQLHMKSTAPRVNKTGTFTPYYDILQNDEIYAVRIIVPLMKDRTAQNLDIIVKPGLRKCLIKGSYIPSTLIGNESAKLLRLKQPLLPVIYSPTSTSGQFDLDIALPDDIRDDKHGVHVIHDCWGILISFPRRKIVHDAHINLVSCFGTAHVTAPRTPLNSTTAIQLQIPARSSPNSPPLLDDVKGVAPGDIQDPSDPRQLIGRKVIISGERWGDQWKGRQYTGFIFEYSDSDGYIIFKAQFDDCEESFDITDLLSHDLITQLEFDQLKRTCLTSEQQHQYDDAQLITPQLAI